MIPQPHTTLPPRPTHLRPVAAAASHQQVQIRRLLVQTLANAIDPALLEEAVRRVQTGLTPHLATPPPRPHSELGMGLTDQQTRILHLIAEGLSNTRIAERLVISEDTVKTHNRKMFSRLGARDRAHAVAIGYRTGILGDRR